MSPESIEESMRNQMIDFLPAVIAQAVENYKSLLEQQPEGSEERDVKALKTYQDACKVAVHHIELLIKLAVWVDIPTQNTQKENAQKALENIIKSADAEIKEKK